MKKSFILLVLLALAVRLSPINAQDLADVPREETLIVDSGPVRVEVPDMWNPLSPALGINLEAGYYQLAWEPFFILNFETGTMDPWLAESATPNDTMDVWTLKLREGITWSDGQPYTADDIVFTADILFAHPDDLGASFVINVEKVTKVDDLTVEFDLVDPDPYFKQGTLSSGIVAQGLKTVPKHIFENEDPVTFSNFDLERGLPLGTGAYRLVRATQTELIWDRQDSYWGSETSFTNLPAPRRVIIVRPGTEEAASALLRQNELDTSTTVSVQTFASMAPGNPQLTGWYPEAPYAWFDPCSRGFWFNTTTAPWDDAEMRHAISDLINRDQVVAIAYGGNSLPAKAPFPAYGGLNEFIASAESAGLFETYPVGTYDPDRAAEILTSKGYTLGGDGYYAKDGQALTMDIVTANYPEIVAIGQVVAEQLQQAGINASSRVMDAGVYSAEVSNGNLTTWIGWDMCGSVTEPFASLNNLNNELLAPIGERANGNYGRWDNAEYSDLVDEMGALGLDDPKRQELGLKAFEIYLRDLPNIPVTQAIKVIAFNTTYWTNWPSAENNYIQPPTWWMSFHTILHHLEPAQAGS